MNERKTKNKSKVCFYGGIDPSASSERFTGCAILDEYGRFIKAGQCKEDEAILDFFGPYAVKAIAIDAPKGLPLKMGLCCLETPAVCQCPADSSRLCERLMRKRGIPLFPVSKNTFPAAKRWIQRGLLLFIRFQGLNIPAFEVYPTGAKKVLFPEVRFTSPKSKRSTRILLQQKLSSFIPDIPKPGNKPFSDHILDAFLGAYTVFLYQEKQFGTLIGNQREGEILLPCSQEVLTERRWQ